MGCSPAAFAAGPAWLEGSWSGYVVDTATSVHTYRAEVYAHRKSSTYTVDYADGTCGGTWTLSSYSSSSATFAEDLTYGGGSCETGGTIIVTKVQSDIVSYTYIEPSSGEMYVSGSLVAE